ncbi:hypothetical protein VTN96DRAFT_1019 [Rasamsonia emersonii]
MSSHRLDHVRRPRLVEVKIPPQTVPSSTSPESAILDSPIVAPSRSMIPKPTNVSTERTRRPSTGASEDEQPTIRPYAKSSRPNDDARSSGLPRPAGNFSSHLPPRRPSENSTATSRSVLSSASPITPITPKTDRLGLSGDRPRNVLRRKAPFRKENGAFSIGTTASRKVEDTQPAAAATSSVATSGSAEQSVGHVSVSAQDPSQSRPADSASAMASKLPRLKTPNPIEESSTRPIPKELAGLSTVVNTHNLPPPPTPNFASAGSPSTRYSESPGMWSSRGSTPTSLSSYSPGIVQPAQVGYRLRQPSPTLVRKPIISRPLTSSQQAEREEHKSVGPQTSPGVSDSNPGTEQGRPVHVSGTNSSPENPTSPPPRKSSVEFKSPKQKDDEEHQQARKDQAVEDAEGHVFGSELQREATTGQSPTSKSPVAPRRPSRQGTDDLELQPSPVIKSNLMTLRTTGHTRRESAEKLHLGERPRPLPTPSAGASVESLQSNASSRIASRTEKPSQIPKRPARTLTKSPKASKDAQGTSSTRRFGLFSKKSKVELAGGNPSQPEKQTRKGPAAGTGHEGYGKYAHRGRRTSISSNSGTRARSTSTTRSGARSISSRKGSVSSRPDLEIDDFLLDRLEPVIINGGGMDQAELVRTQSGQSTSNLSVTSMSAHQTAKETQPLGGFSSESLVSSTEPFAQPPRFLRSDSHLPSQVEEGRQAALKDRSFQPPQKFETDTAEKGSMSQDEPTFSALPQISTEAPSAREASDSEAGNKPKKSDKRGKGMVWNFFYRTHSAGQKVPSPPASASHPTTELHATVTPVSNNRSVAHYALIDGDSNSLEEILRRVEESPPTEEENAPSSDTTADPDMKKPHGSSVLLPSPPALWTEYSNSREVRSASPKVFFQKDVNEDNVQPSQPRLSRLTPVGRIPQVVSRRDRDHKPAAESFSRPFSRDEAPSLTITANSQPDVYYSSSRPPLGVQTDVLPSKPFGPEPDTPKPSSDAVPNEGMKFASGAYASNEFLQFSPRKQSRVSSSTESEDTIMKAVTAMGPRSDWKPTEDEVWTEYDDLLDSVALPESGVLQQQPKSDEGGPFEMVTKASKTLQAELNASSDDAAVPETPSVVPPPASARSCDGSVRLRRSNIASALHSGSPSPQVSCNELTAGCGEETKSSQDAANSDRPSEPTQTNDPSIELRPSTPTTVPDFESTRRRNTVLFDIAERDREGTAAQTNLRSASLMTSRWLSFGRVLFSPAHNRVKSTDQERILVIDGLGNDDWSYYCALTYPNANVYSLSMRQTSSTSTHPAAWQPPENHHLIPHTSVDSPFPFPKGFFTVCILRFPAACSEYGQRNIISECKRVLRPGGYLEMSILDLDLVNMGNRTRKAVRMLKERIYLADPSISLKPASDNIQKLLGTFGFDNLKRCMVSVPVSGVIVGSSDSSNSNHSASTPTPKTSTGPSSNPASATESQSRKRTSSDTVEQSLGDLLSDPSPSASNDEYIARMVARVGRWWYTRCYEIPVLSDGAFDRSIWADRKLLRECQKRGTGFRLLIAYAQKPNEKRRTASV